MSYMDFLIKVRDTIHGWSEETRKFLAMTVMAVALVTFFIIWGSNVSSHLVAISLPPVAQNTQIPSPTASLPQDVGLEDTDTFGQGAELQPSSLNQIGSQGQMGVSAPAASGQAAMPLPEARQEEIVQEQAPTPVQGMAETFSGLKRLFTTADTHSSVATWMQQKFGDLGGLMWRAAAYLLTVARNALQDIVSWGLDLVLHQFPGFGVLQQ